jgi:hypothetical protein
VVPYQHRAVGRDSRVACKEWPYIIVGSWLRRSDGLDRWGDQRSKLCPPSDPTHWMSLPKWPAIWHDETLAEMLEQGDSWAEAFANATD